MHNLENREFTDHQEMYLKVIYTLMSEHKVARVKEIAERLDVTKSSVSSALKSLSDKGLVVYDPYSYVELTPKGKKLAARVLSKYDILTNFLVEILEVPEDLAHENACRMEHVVDDKVMKRLVQFLEFCRGCDIQCWKEDAKAAKEELDKCCIRGDLKS